MKYLTWLEKLLAPTFPPFPSCWAPEACPLCPLPCVPSTPQFDPRCPTLCSLSTLSYWLLLSLRSLALRVIGSISKRLFSLPKCTPLSCWPTLINLTKTLKTCSQLVVPTMLNSFIIKGIRFLESFAAARKKKSNLMRCLLPAVAYIIAAKKWLWF